MHTRRLVWQTRRAHIIRSSRGCCSGRSAKWCQPHPTPPPALLVLLQLCLAVCKPRGSAAFENAPGSPVAQGQGGAWPRGSIAADTGLGVHTMCNTHCNTATHTTHLAIHWSQQQHICQVLQIPAGFMMESRCGTAAHNTWTRAHDHRARERALVCAAARCAPNGAQWFMRCCGLADRSDR